MSVAEPPPAAADLAARYGLSKDIPGFRVIPEYRPGVMICTGMDRPLWPRRWRLFRDGFFVLRVTAIYAKPKRANLGEYRRRQRARVKRRRR